MTNLLGSFIYKHIVNIILEKLLEHLQYCLFSSKLILVVEFFSEVIIHKNYLWEMFEKYLANK